MLLMPPLTRRAGQILFDPTRRFDEIDGVIAVLLQAGRHGKNVGIENDVAGGEIERVASVTRKRAGRFRFCAQDYQPARARRKP